MGIQSVAKLEFTKEAQTAVNILDDHLDRMLHHERLFVEELKDKFERFGDQCWVSERQIGWLRKLVSFYG